jgi:hypothetical protein
LPELRPFVAWDGEGVNNEDPESGDHPYSLFGSSLGWRVKAYNLSTLDCLSLMIETERACPEAIHFGFAFGYDVNMILKDLPITQLKALKRYNQTRFMGYDIEYIPRKWLRVGYGHKGKQRTSIQLFDVFSFFNAGLGSVLRKYNIGSPEQLARIDAGKGERPNFSFDDITSSIEPYWETELVLMVSLMEEFRRILHNAGFFINSWHGPGAIASYLLRKHDAEQFMDPSSSPEILEAARYSYFGGRFEPLVAGYYDGTVYSADINSAYPYSYSRLPSLSNGKWNHCLGRGENPAEVRLGMYKIRYSAPYSSKAMPLPHRSASGSVSFPNATEGWYHAAEAAMVYSDPYAEFLESWIYEDDGTFPYAWVEDIYEQRLEMQRIGDPTQLALKLGPNSIYGQVAQRAGWEKRGGPPKWHQLELAGGITSECRSMVYSVARQAGKSLVSIDTDGVLSLSPFRSLPNGAGNRLGQWKTTEYTGVLYIQNGIYWLRDAEGVWLPPKSRGIPRKKLAFDTVWPIISRGDDISISQHMFIGFGTALRGRMGEWRHWVDEPRTISFGGSGKRIHTVRSCPACRRGLGHTEALHKLVSVPPSSILSAPHHIPWLEVPKEVEDLEGWPDLSRPEADRDTIMELEKWGIME